MAEQRDLAVTGTPRFTTLTAHRLWLIDNARALFEFHQRPSFNPAGGFFSLDENARPLPPKPGHKGANRHVHDTARMVHAFAIAHLLGLPGADRIVDHGLAFLWERMRDGENGGYFWGVDDEKPTDATKQAYGHAFVLLAASSAMCVGHPDAPRLLADVTQVIEERFWDKAAGASTEEYNPDWSPMGTYRGQNSNMHLTEALMAAFEATGERFYLDKAESIASLIIDRHARAEGWRVAEHFTGKWEVDRAYRGDPMFRPSGATPGHALEWSRLLVQLWELGGRSKAWMIEAAAGTLPQDDIDRLGQEAWRLLLHARLERPAGSDGSLLVAPGRRRRGRRRARLGRVRPDLRGMVPAHLELPCHSCDRQGAWLAART